MNKIDWSKPIECEVGGIWYPAKHCEMMSTLHAIYPIDTFFGEPQVGTPQWHYESVDNFVRNVPPAEPVTLGSDAERAAAKPDPARVVTPKGREVSLWNESEKADEPSCWASFENAWFFISRRYGPIEDHAKTVRSRLVPNAWPLPPGTAEKIDAYLDALAPAPANPDPAIVEKPPFTPTPHEPVEAVTLWQHDTFPDGMRCRIEVDGVTTGYLDRFGHIDDPFNFPGHRWVQPNSQRVFGNTHHLPLLIDHARMARLDALAPAAAKGEGKAEPWYAKVTSENALRVRVKGRSWFYIRNVAGGKIVTVDNGDWAFREDIEVQLLDGTILHP